MTWKKGMRCHKFAKAEIFPFLFYNFVASRLQKKKYKCTVAYFFLIKLCTKWIYFELNKCKFISNYFLQKIYLNLYKSLKNNWYKNESEETQPCIIIKVQLSSFWLTILQIKRNFIMFDKSLMTIIMTFVPFLNYSK